jgi:hypothetical protein
MEMIYYDVIIATPGTSMCYNYVKSLIDTINALNERGLTYKYINCQGSPVNIARENVIEEIIKYSYNKVIWIDSDIGFTPDDFLKLYYSDKDIISGAYLLANGVTSTIALLPEDRKLGQMELTKNDILRLSNPMKVQTVGFGFVAITHNVISKIPKPYFKLINDVIQNNFGKNLYISLGEDISFFIKAHNVGFDVWFDPNVLVNHMKTQTVSWK